MVSFFTENIWGIILLSVSSGIVGSIIAAIAIKGYNLIHVKYKKKKTIKYLVKVGSAFGLGSKTVYAMNHSPLHQSLIVGDFIVDLLIMLCRMILAFMLSIALLVVFRNYWISIPIIAFVLSAYSYFEIVRIKECKQMFDIVYKYVFGDEYARLELEGVKQYWDKITNNTSNKESNNE